MSKLITLTKSLLVLIIFIPLQGCFNTDVEIDRTTYGVTITNQSNSELTFFYQSVNDERRQYHVFKPVEENIGVINLGGIAREGEEGPLVDLQELRDQFIVFKVEAFIDGELIVIEPDFELDLEHPKDTNFTIDSFFSSGEKSYTYRFDITDEYLTR